MEIGIVYPQIELGGDPDAVRQIGKATEDLGYDYLLAYDHVLGAVHADRDPKLMGPYTEQDPFHDPMVMFSYLAGMTERIGFATGVIILPQRQTALLAKQAADLDLLSGERFRLGVGVGWNHVEYDALGQEFSTRGKRADEQIELMRKYWTGEVLSFDGEFDQVDRANILPAPKRQIPIWVGGFSDPAFRRGARHGDGFIFGGGVSRSLEGMGRIEHFAAETGRDLTGFGKEMLLNKPGTAADAAADVERWREAGGTHTGIVTMGRNLDSVEAHLDYIAEVKSLVG